jgi:hypothetical protein
MTDRDFTKLMIALSTVCSFAIVGTVVMNFNQPASTSQNSLAKEISTQSLSSMARPVVLKLRKIP